METASLPHFTVWRCESVRGEVVTFARHSEPGEESHQHSRQRIAWQGPARSKADAISQAEES